MRIDPGKDAIQARINRVYYETYGRGNGSGRDHVQEDPEMAERIDSGTGEIVDMDEFNPSRHISKVKGNDYLEVKYRIAWLRSAHPTADIDTELISHEGGRAIMRAIVRLPGGGSATGWGSETSQGFENYVEKAETKAMGRALAALGFGTVDALDLEDGSNPLADAPVNRQGGSSYSGSNNGGGQPFMATPAQKSRIQRLAADLRMEPEGLQAKIYDHTGASWETLNKRQASGVIDMLEALRPQGAGERSQVSGASSGTSRSAQANPGTSTASSRKPSGGGERANAGQIKAILTLATKLQMPDGYLITYAADVAGENLETIDDLSSDGAGEVIVALQAEKVA